MAVVVRARVGGNIGTGLMSGFTIGGGALKASDKQGIVNRWLAFVNRAMAVAPRATYNALLPTFEKSQIYCPKDTGDLVDSGYLEITNRFARGGTDPVVEMGYGRGGNPPYALIVHEVLTAKHRSPTRAKFLQLAMQEDKRQILPRVAAQLRV